MARRKSLLLKTYRGVLATPWKPDPNKSNEENMRGYNEMMHLKMPALFDHYEVDQKHPEKWQWLAYYLALAHVPGFIEPPLKKPGRKPIDGMAAADAILFMELRCAELTPGKSASGRARQLSKPKGRWAWFRGRKLGTLLNRYNRLKDERTQEHKRMVEVVANCTPEECSDLPDYAAKVPDLLRGALALKSKTKKL